MATTPDFVDKFENADEARKRIDEQNREIQRREQSARLETAGDATTKAWLEEETSRDTDYISFRDREFEFKRPGLIHRKTMISLASEMNPEDFEDVDPNDDGEIDEVLEETFDADGLKTVDKLYTHTLETLSELCLDEHMGDDTVPPGDDLSLGAQRWGRFPQEDEMAEGPDGEEFVNAEGISSLFRRTVMQRGENEGLTDSEDGEGGNGR